MVFKASTGAAGATSEGGLEVVVAVTAGIDDCVNAVKRRVATKSMT